MEGMKAVHCTVCYRLVPGSSVSSGRENTEEEKGKEVKLCPLAEGPRGTVGKFTYFRALFPSSRRHAFKKEKTIDTSHVKV
jgi:hypothetical protein